MNLQTINASASPEVQMNENFETLEHQAVYGLRQPVTTGLTWGYCGGRWGGFAITESTLTLTDDSANYIVVAIATGVASVSTATTNWNDDANYVRVYKVTAASGAVTAVEDHRAGPLGVHGGGGSGGGITTLTGDVTASGSGSVAATIANDSVTYAKMQNVSATSRALGRKTAGAGDTEELTLSELLDFIGSAAQGDILYRGASAWARLGAGTSGQFLQTQGASANPTWATPSGGTSMSTVTALSISSGVVDIDCSLGDYYTLALTENVTSITFSNLPGSGKGASKLVRITQDSTARTVAWPASFKWAGGSAGAVSTASGAVDVLAISTFDNGTTWRATLAKAFA